MVTALLRSTVGLPDRIFSRLADIPEPPRHAEIYAFAQAAWPQDRRKAFVPLALSPRVVRNPPVIPTEQQMQPHVQPPPLDFPAGLETKNILSPDIKSEIVSVIKPESKLEAKPEPQLETKPKIRFELKPFPMLEMPVVASKPKLTLPEVAVAAQPTEVAAEAFPIPSSEILRANKVAELQRRHLDIANQQQPPGCHVMAWSMIPATAWQGANATFMMLAGDFFHACAENTLLLPVTRKGADQFQLPQYPLRPDPATTEMAHAEISKLRTALAMEHKQVLMAMQRGDMTALSNRPARKKKLADDLKRLALKLAVIQFGKAAIERHQTLFGGALGYETPPSV